MLEWLGRHGRWVALAIAVLLAGVFAFLNAGEQVAINLGFTVLYQVPLAGLVFAVYLLGMVTMFLIGLRHDLRVRRILREERSAPAPPPPSHPWPPAPPPDPSP